MKLRLIFSLLFFCMAGCVFGQTSEKTVYNTISIPQIDWNDRTDLQIVTDQRDGVYLGHVNTVLLDDDKTILAVYPQGHASGAIQYKKSLDGGLTWGECLSTPKSWEQNDECPTMFRTVDANGKKRILVFQSGSFPIKMSVSEDEGETWSEFAPIGPYGGFVAMSSMIPLNTGKGHYIAFYNDRERKTDGSNEWFWSTTRLLYSIVTRDGGVTWEEPKLILKRSDINAGEPCAVRSPDGKQIAVLLRENTRRYNSQIIFSNDEGETWTDPVPLPNSLTGDRHVARYLNDGRLIVLFRQMSLPINGTPFSGDWVAWVGSYSDLVHQSEGDFVIRLKDNFGGDFSFPPTGVVAREVDCGYCGVVVQKDGTVVATTYGCWDKEKKHYILTVRIPMGELAELK
ncbi:MAG: sialidase family protein [Planctomycetia bacterium]|nr:sialidase family protein [Planctomycetia bacterium]